MHTCFDNGPNTLSNVNFFESLSCGLSRIITSLFDGTSTTDTDFPSRSALFIGLVKKKEIIMYDRKNFFLIKIQIVLIYKIISFFFTHLTRTNTCIC